MASRDLVGGYDEERFENKVAINLICSICLNVLKDPVQCSNEHYFCGSCMQKHLHENSETCPLCQQSVTEETLTKPSRILLELLLNLKIQCDHAKQGCPELIKLECLDRHAETCGYLPTHCTNPGCSEVVNRRDQEQHECELCRFRKIVCDECGQELVWASSDVHACVMRKGIDDLARKFNDFQTEVKDDVKQMKLTQEEFINEVRNLMVRESAASRDEVNKIREAAERSDLFTGRKNVFVTGGNNGKTCLSSVERYSWPENTWTLGPAMKKKRSVPSAFIHEWQIFVAGGWTGTKNLDSIESLNVDKKNKEWIESPVRMPVKCHGHKIICHENSAILTGGRDGDNFSDGVHEIQLNTPYNTRLLTKMPEPRYYHGCEIIDNQIVVVGGRTSTQLRDARDTVYLYDINNNECKPTTPLPFPISQMATVTYKGNVVIIGGVDKKSRTLNRTSMYNVKTGNITNLPNLNHKRAGSAAVITGNVILVVGGYDFETKTWLDSVECLDLNRLNSCNAWKVLSPMTSKRSLAIAVVMPSY